MNSRNLARILIAALLFLGAATSTHAADIAVFGNNSIQTFLNANGHTATVVSDADLATPGFLDSFDLFVYTRDGASFGTSLSAPAAANVSAFVTGNVVLFTSDLQDNGFPGDATNTLLLNAVSWVGSGGYIGEFTGSCAAMITNTVGLEPLGLVDGTCTALNFGPGGDPMDIVQNDHPVVAGVPDPVSLGDSHEFFALVGTDNELVLAVNSSGIPSIVAYENIIEVAIDIKFCSDPNAFNCNKGGVLPVTIFGTEDFDVLDIDVSTLLLCTEDLSQCTRAPRGYSIADRGDPDSDLGAAQCAIIEVEDGIFEEQDYLNPDEFLDLDAAFEASDVQAMLGDFCGADKGAISETLVVIGSTLDGTPIVSVPVGNSGIDQLLKQNK